MRVLSSIQTFTLTGNHASFILFLWEWNNDFVSYPIPMVYFLMPESFFTILAWFYLQVQPQLLSHIQNMYKGIRMYVVIIILMIRTFVALDIPVYEEGVKSPKEHHQYSFELITNCISFLLSIIRFHITRYRNFVYNLGFQLIH